VKYYVYLLCYPNGTPFYVGKGQRKRVEDHEKAARRGCDCAKCGFIRAIWQAGGTVQRAIVFETSREQEALDYEKTLIARYGLNTLANKEPGSRGRRPRVFTLRPRARDLISREGLSTTEFAELAGIDRSIFYRSVGVQGVMRQVTAWKIASAYAKIAGITEDEAWDTLISEA
jgi:hypothetical protein